MGYDGISDRGDEIYNYLCKLGIKNVALMGVHTNMCVLGRPFGIRQQVRLGTNTVLVRDLTDAMYDPAAAARSLTFSWNGNGCRTRRKVLVPIDSVGRPHAGCLGNRGAMKGIDPLKGCHVHALQMRHERTEKCRSRRAAR